MKKGRIEEQMSSRKRKARVILITTLVIAGFTLACEPIENEVDKTRISNDSTDLENQEGTDPESWLIPESQVFDGGPGKDGIPALSNPEFITAGNVDYLEDTSLVIGIRIGNETRAYPHSILDWHEIINDAIGSDHFSIIYCPLTGTGMAWDLEISSGLTSYGVSGLLYNSNIIPYDRATDSYWSQIRLECVGGKLRGEKPELLTIVETSWATWKEMYPDSKVVSTETGYNRSYGIYPYDYYMQSDILIFPVSNYDSRVFSKERVHGIIHNSGTYILRFEKFAGATKLYTEIIGDQRIIIVGNEDKNFIVSFVSDDDPGVTYSALQDQFPLVFMDSNGNKYDVFGKIISGAGAGQSIEATSSFMGYWFSWAAFYPDLKIID